MHLLEMIGWRPRQLSCITLRVQVGTETDGTHEVYQLPAVIGRSYEADLRVPDGFVSRAHCMLRRSGNSIVVRDLESRHGTWVNGDRIAERKLEVDDVIFVGTSRLTVVSVDATQACS
jgi:pSer/pThr/pTyr-binding forkhead associated (FHA) protein